MEKETHERDLNWRLVNAEKALEYKAQELDEDQEAHIEVYDKTIYCAVQPAKPDSLLEPVDRALGIEELLVYDPDDENDFREARSNERRKYLEETGRVH